MKRLFLLLCLVGILQLTEAQKTVIPEGDIMAELRLQNFEKDPSAEAVVLYDVGTSYFSPSEQGLDMFFERKIKIKIFTKAGIKWGEFEIPFYDEKNTFETFTVLEGTTYNLENGQIRKSVLNPKTAFDEKVNSYYHNKKFAMPDVKEGSVIEVSYKIKSPLLKLRNWVFQSSIPVVYSSYVTKMVPFYEYTFTLQGANKFSSTKDYIENGLSTRFAGVEYQNFVHEYTMKDLPAFKDESYITSENDFLVKLDFQLSAIHRPNGSTEAIMSTWPKLIEEFIKEDSFGKYVKSSQDKSKDFLDTMKLANKSKLEKAQIIEHFVKTNFKWDGFNDKFASKSVKEFIKSKTGNSADINLYLAGMLNAAGVESYPVLLSTRGHGKIHLNYPFAHYFNSTVVLAKIDTLMVLLDATEPLSNFTEIPSRCFNGQGLIIQKNKADWVDLKSNKVSNEMYYLTLQPEPANDSIKQSCRLITTGYEAINYRNKFAESYTKLKENLQGLNATKGDSLKPINLTKIELPFELEFKKKSALEQVEDKLIISPFGTFVPSENPLKQPSRSYPVDFVYVDRTGYETTIEIPKGYKLLSVPKPMNIEDDMVKIQFSATTTEAAKIKITGIYEFKKDVYQSNEYMFLKDYFNKIVDKFNEKVILVKES